MGDGHFLDSKAMTRTAFALALLLAALPAAAQETAPPAAAEDGRVYEMTEVERLPSPTNVADLQAALAAGYPPALLQAGTGGTVMVAFVVGGDGMVGQASVVSSTDSAFDAPSLAAVAVLRFTPGMVGGAPVATRVAIPIEWRAPAPVAAAEAAERVYELDDVDVQPRPINIPQLAEALERRYPVHLRDRAIWGLVHVRLRVDREGVPRDIRVTGTSNHDFNLPTMQSVELLRFQPARLDGRTVDVWVDLPIQWQVQ